MIRSIAIFLLLKLLVVPTPNPLNASFQVDHYTDGEHKLYAANGVVSVAFNIKNGNLDGKYYSFYYDGTKCEVLHFSNGHFHDANNDTNKTYNQDGKILYNEVYKHDTLLYECQYDYYKDGTLESVYWLSFDKDSLSIFPFMKAKIKTRRVSYDMNLSVKNMKSYGKYLEYSNTGKLDDETDIVNAKYEGDYRSYFESGKLYCQGTYHNDVLDGICTYYEEDGSIRKTEVWSKGKLVKQ